jgi:Na+/citrate or Na+/malate symporter
VTFISIHSVIICVVFFGACMRCTQLCPLKPGVTSNSFKSFFRAGLRFPLYEMIGIVLWKFEIYLHQLTLNAIVILSVYIWALRSQGMSANAEGFYRVHEHHYQTKARADGLNKNFG